MVPQIERDELLSAWRALASMHGREGWRTIHIAIGSPCRVLAGRHFPGNEEALLVRFMSARIPPEAQLPQGRGFLVSQVQPSLEGEPGEWLALRRQRAGSLELFALMALDLVATISGPPSGDDSRILPVFLARIRAWQEFMRRTGDGMLTGEEEVGLYGELELLWQLLEVGLPADMCVNSWEGPLDGLQDFRLGMGAIEVKSTLAQKGFEASITSLDQLDESLIQPLFLAGVRLAQGPVGRTLPEMIVDLRGALVEDPTACAELNTRLLKAGYCDEFANSYTRRFTCVGSRLLAVRNTFPRLTKSNVSEAIRSARYEIELDLITDGEFGLTEALQQLGVI